MPELRTPDSERRNDSFEHEHDDEDEYDLRRKRKRDRSNLGCFDYGRRLYQERELLSVTVNTREDLRAFLAEAVEARTTSYALTDVNRGLLDTKRSNIEGTPVLAIG